MKKIFATIGGFFKKIFGRGRVHQYATAAVKVVEVLKLIVESPLINLATAAIPGVADDVLVVQAKMFLPYALKSLEFIRDANGLSALQVIQEVAKKIAALDPAGQSKAYQRVAALIVEAMADGKVTIAEAVGVVELAYAEFKIRANG